MTHPYWPLFDVEVRTPRITLRYVDDELAVRLAALAGRGIHDPSWMPFALPWTDVASPELEQNTLRYYWRTRAELTPVHWDLPLAVLVDDEVVGACSVGGEHFAVLRTFETGSWLGRSHQGKGLGKELRAASLHLGFEGLGARVATTAAYEDNAASLAVTKALGYSPNGARRELRRNQVGVQLMFQMTVDHWCTIRRDDIELVGVEATLPFLGLEPDLESAPLIPDAGRAHG